MTARALRWVTGGYVVFLLALILLVDLDLVPNFLVWLDGIPASDKILHVVLIGVFAYLVNRSVGCHTWKLWGIQILSGSAILAVLMTIEELSQLAMPHRSFSLVDLACNYLGIAVFGRLALQRERRKKGVA